MTVHQLPVRVVPPEVFLRIWLEEMRLVLLAGAPWQTVLLTMERHLAEMCAEVRELRLIDGEGRQVEANLN